jgi:hypothetical protein
MYSGFEETYEYFFNLSQVCLKDGLVEDSIKFLK